MTPPMIHAAKTMATEPTARAMSLETRKIPVPIVSPMTMAVADHSPRLRTRWDEPVCFVIAGVFGAMQCKEPTLRDGDGQVGSVDVRKIGGRVSAAGVSEL